MKNCTLILTAVIGAALTLSSCSEPGKESMPATPSVEPAVGESSPASDDIQRSDRGNIIKKVGEPGGTFLSSGSKERAFTFTVTNIEIDPVCTREYSSPAENGHMVALTIEATTAPERELTESGLSGVSFHPFQWKAIAPNGTTANTVYSVAADNCFPEAEMITDVGPGEKAVGKVVLDVPDVTGILAFSHGGSPGWEWQYGPK